MRAVAVARGIVGALSCLLVSACLASGLEEDWEETDDELVEVDGLTQELAAFEVASFQNVKSSQTDLNSKCIGVDGASTANGALLKLFTCDAKPNQSWRIARDGVLHTMRNVKSDRCMGVDRASKSPGANIGQYGCDSKRNQKWLLEVAGGTTANPIAYLRNANSDLCIGVDGASTANGAQLRQFGCDNAINQQWRLIER